ncbi:MAG: transcription/translation regulatory transformer protein RfaH [Pseudohongiellaceae bacterium]
MQHWHLLMTKPREDERAELHLQNQDYEIFRPLLRHHVIKKGRQKAVTESLFPRYLFICLDDEFSDWSAIRSTRGVAGLVRFNNQPAIVPDQLIHDIRCRTGDSMTLDTTAHNPFVYHQGDRVEVVGGCFKGLQAIVQTQKSEERVILLLNLLGNTQTLEFDLTEIKAIA